MTREQIARMRAMFAELAAQKIGELHRRPALSEDMRGRAAHRLGEWYKRLTS